MATKIEHTGDTAVLTPTGNVDSITAASIEKEILDAISAGSSHIVLDLSQVVYMSSAGLRVMIVAAKRSKQRSGTFALCNPQPRVLEVFEVSGLVSLVTIKGSLGEAMASVGASA